MASLINLAIRQARESQCRFKVGAVLAAGNRVLAAAPNRRRNSPVIDFQHATFHAEEAAIRRARNPYGTVIYVARINAVGIPLLARPCPRCQAALYAAGVTKAYYTVGPTKVGSMIIRPPMRAKFTRAPRRWP